MRLRKRPSNNNIPLLGKGTLETEEDLLRDVSDALETEKFDYRVTKYTQI